MVRFRVSATKHLDIETSRIGIFNYILSKKLDKPLLINIDDTDKQNNIENIEKEILELLNLFSIDHERVVYQSENLKYHQKIIMQLMAKKEAFACFCSDEKLNELKEEAKKENKPIKYDGFCSTLSDETVLNCNAPFTVRIKEPNSKITINDLLKGKINYEPYEIDSYIALAHDKMPKKVYANAIDDMIYNISTVVLKDEESIDSARETYTRALLSYDTKIDYLHLPKISNNKSLNNLKWFIDEGYLPSAIANYLVSISLKNKNQIVSLEDIIKSFDVKEIITNDIVFEIEELKKINKKHIELMDNLRLSKILAYADADIGSLAKLFLDEVSTIKELKEKITLIFQNKENDSLDNKFLEVKNCMKSAPFFNNLDELKKYIEKHTNLKENEIEKIISYLVLGNENGPDMKDIYPLIKNYIGEIIK